MHIRFHIAPGKRILDIGRKPFYIQPDDRHAKDQQRNQPTEYRQPDPDIFLVDQLSPIPFIDRVGGQEGDGEPRHR